MKAQEPHLWSLGAEDESYRFLFESVPTSILLVDLDDRIIAVNSAAQRLTGYSELELTGKSIEAIVAPEWRDVHRVRRGSPPIESHHAVVLLDREARRLPVQVASIPFRVDGLIVGTQEFLTPAERDKRSERALRESEERFRVAFDAAAIGMAIVGLDGRYLQVNPSLCEILGYSSSELTTLTFQEVTHPDDLPWNLDQLRKALAGELVSYAMEKRYRRRNGTSLWILLTVSLVHGTRGETAYFVTQVQDIDRQKRARLELRQLQDRHPKANLLTPRELDALKLIATGHTNEQAGRHLGISDETVSTHVRHAMRKLDAPTRTAAVATAVRLQLLFGEPDDAAGKPQEPPSRG